MKILHSQFRAPRKELSSRLQKNVVILLFTFLLAFAGLYVFMNISLQNQNERQEKQRDFLSVVHNVEERWLELLLVEDKRSYLDSAAMSSLNHLSDILMDEYDVLESKVGHFHLEVEPDFSNALALLGRLSQRDLDVDPLLNEERKAVYFSFEVLEVLGDELIQIGVGLEYERKTLIKALIWIPVTILLFIVFIVLAISIQFYRQLQSGFASLHYILDHHKHGHGLVVPPRNVVDEFTDLSHLIDNELSSRTFDFNQKSDNIALIEKALSKLDSAFLITNDEGDIVCLSAGAERLWRKNTALFESVFGIDSGLESPVGEQILNSILMSDQELTLKLSDGVYGLNTECLTLEPDTDDGGLQYIVFIRLKSEIAELEVLHNSLKLLEQDVWGVPIRVLRADSPYIGFAQSLESVRRNVEALFDVMNATYENTGFCEKITKLQQIASLIDKKSDHNKLSTGDIVTASDAILEKGNVELNNIALLSEQLRDSLVLGYELVLQRLALIEKDLSSDVFLLKDVDRCLNEVRAGVLSSLSAAKDEEESVRLRFSIDLEHDISSVQAQIEGMKVMTASTLSLLETDRSIGLVRLDRARESIDKIVGKVHGIMANTTSSIQGEKDSRNIIEESDDEWDSL